MRDCGCEVEIKDRSQRGVLWILLAINATMFIVELVAGLLAESTGLLADSIDMLADAGVYAIALIAVGRAARHKAHAAMASGVFQLVLALGVAGDVVRRFAVGSNPLFGPMIGIGLLALAANLVCLALISKHRTGEVHMRASWIFSANDVLANVGVLTAGLLVYYTGSRLPDLLIGGAIALLVLVGGIRIIVQARRAYAEPMPETRPAGGG